MKKEDGDRKNMFVITDYNRVRYKQTLLYKGHKVLLFFNMTICRNLHNSELNIKSIQ